MQPPTRADSESSWRIGPSHPHLPEDAVDVWRADLTEADDSLADLLSDEELARAQRLLNDRNRLLWTRSRGLLRALLGRYLGESPRALHFVHDARGKPRLSEPARGPASGGPTAAGAHVGLSFNLSHSGELALYAFCAGAAVGVDVEADDRSIDEVAIAARVLGAHTAASLKAITDPAARRREFLRAWTRYEATAKCVGTGIGAGAAEALERRVWVADLDPGAGAAGAVACEREPSELRCWE
jgi:4'-phosphopantetheinyl transferase